MYWAFGHIYIWLANSGSALNHRLVHQRGQGTVEYVGLILVVALLMTGVVAAMSGFQSDEGKNLAQIIIQKIQQAVNKVTFS